METPKHQAASVNFPLRFPRGLQTPILCGPTGDPSPSMNQTIATDSPFRDPQRGLLEALAELMIPAAEGLPSAADPAIFSSMLAALARQAATADTGLERLTTLVKQRFRRPFSALSHAEKLESIAALRSEEPGFMALFESTVAASYYTDDRVLRTLDLPPRAPFPEGHAVPPTDWSLLDPVRQRAPFYRNV
ncbi:MAG: gluconate 2-dehydrogenase subunit 3 family protein [Gammaproteobacteria bacterium]|nr:gluconate 2-dehydrogenase subunit 3 family protein [Gammaproteobacteria bacterium]